MLHFRTIARFRICSVTGGLALLAGIQVLLAVMPSRAFAQAPGCVAVSGRFIAQSPSGNGSVQFCLPSDPAIAALQEGLNRLLQQSADNAPRLQRMTRALEGMSSSLSDKQLQTLAKSLASQLDPLLADGDTRVSRAIERLSLNVEEMQEKVKEASSTDADTGRVQAALAGNAGDAIARLDFEAAGRLFDDLKSIRESLESANQKLDQMGQDNAFQRLSEIAKTKPKGEIGQTAAVRALVASGSSFAGMDLSGIPFRSVQVDSVDLSGANLMMAAFRDSHLHGANFRNTDITAVDFTGSDLSQADLTAALGPFVLAAGAVFQAANLGRSSWVAADLKKANFRNADLRGANFGLADLRGADFRGANLQNTFFGGADLRDALFEGAGFSNTDVVAAVLQTSTLIPAQRKGLCSAAPSRGAWGVQFVVMEDLVKPITTQMEDILRYKDASVSWPGAALRMFPACAPVPKDSLPRGRLKGDANDLRDQFRIDVPGTLMENSRRRDDLISLIMERVGAAAERVAAINAMPEAKIVADAQARLLADRLAELSGQAKPIKAPRLELTDTQTVLLQRLAPASLETLIGGRNMIASEDSGAWPILFADPSMGYYANWSSSSTKSWRSWVAARSTAWKDGNVVINDTSPCIDPGRGASELMTAAAALLATPIDRLAPGPYFSASGPNVDGTAWEVMIPSILLFDSPPGKMNTCALQISGAHLVETAASEGTRGDRFLVWSTKPSVQPEAARKSDLSVLDVLGIRLGMPQKEANVIVKSHMKVGWIYSRLKVAAMGDRPHQALNLYISQDRKENIAVYSASAPKGSVVVAIRRTEVVETPPPNDVLQEMLIKKYGPNTQGAGAEHWLWGTGSCGNKGSNPFSLGDFQRVEGTAMSNDEFVTAVRALDLMDRSADFTPSMFQKYGLDKCGPYLHVFKQEKLIETTLLDFSRTPWTPPADYVVPRF